MSLSRPSSPSVDETAAAMSKPPTAPSVKRGRRKPRKKTRVPRNRKGPTRTVTSAPKPETQTGSQDRYQLRQKRQPRNKCGTCGLRDCESILAVNEKREVSNGARGVPRRDD